MALRLLPDFDRFTLALVFGSLVVLGSIFTYLFSRPPLPKNAPKLAEERWPILGAMQFFTRRWDFMRAAIAHSATGNYSFYAGQYPVIGLSGPESRKIFFESKSLGFSEGYAALLGGSPKVTENNNPLAEVRGEDTEFAAYFTRRIVAMLKGNKLAKSLPTLLQDVRASMDALAADASGITDPFESVYRMVFQLTMRTVAANEIAEDAALLERTLSLYEAVEGTATPLSIMYPWLPLPAKVKRTYAGAQLYMIFKRVVDERKRLDKREDDALQFLIDQNDSITDIITFVLGALFAGQLNSGVNAAWVLIYLAHKPYWLERVREEVNGVADKYCADDSLPLKDRLMKLPIDAWENEFPLIDMCLKDSIRLQLSGAAFRKNITDQDIPLNKAGTEVIPAGAYVTTDVGSIHYNPDIYANPDEWDPARYMPDRAEDKKVPYSFMGWGLARHPCLGMRFAKLENNILLAFFVAYFDDIRLSDAKGNQVHDIPVTDRNSHTARKPQQKIHLRYSVRQ